MKLYYFEKNKKIVGWATGQADYQTEGCVTKTVELNDEDYKKITEQTHQPILENEKIKFIPIFDSKKEEKKILKAKFQSGQFDNEDIKKLVELIL